MVINNRIQILIRFHTQ